MIERCRKVVTEVLIAAFLCLSVSCSLNYVQDTEDESSCPEFIFNGVTMVRYENGSKTASIKASQIEKYKNNDATFAKDVEFQTWDSKNKVENKGKCEYLSANSDDKTYTLLRNIEINNIPQNLKISARSLKWNGNSEQLTGGKNDIVVIERNDLKMEGIGFSASAIDKSFLFTGKIDGIIIIEED